MLLVLVQGKTSMQYICRYCLHLYQNGAKEELKTRQQQSIHWPMSGGKLDCQVAARNWVEFVISFVYPLAHLYHQPEKCKNGSIRLKFHSRNKLNKTVDYQKTKTKQKFISVC